MSTAPTQMVSAGRLAEELILLVDLSVGKCCALSLMREIAYFPSIF